MRRCFVVLVAAAVAIMTFCFAVPAGANVIGRSDGNDSKSPLDMSGFKISDGGSSQVFKITTFSKFSNKQIDGKAGNFFVGIDTNADNKYDFHVYILFAAGKMRGVLTNKRGATITYRLKASRQRRSASVAVPLSKIGTPRATARSPCRISKGRLVPLGTLVSTGSRTYSPASSPTSRHRTSRGTAFRRYRRTPRRP